MSREGAVMVMMAVALLVLLLMLLGWRRRSKRDAGLVAPTAAIEGDVRGSFTGLYVATTESNRPLDRRIVRHLTFRSKVKIQVLDSGVTLDIPGQPRVSIPKEIMVAAGRATWTIDRVVERDGLVYLTWFVAPDTAVDSYFRLQEDSPADLVTSLEHLLASAETGTSL